MRTTCDDSPLELLNAVVFPLVVKEAVLDGRAVLLAHFIHAQVFECLVHLDGGARVHDHAPELLDKLVFGNRRVVRVQLLRARPARAHVRRYSRRAVQQSATHLILREARPVRHFCRAEGQVHVELGRVLADPRLIAVNSATRRLLQLQEQHCTHNNVKSNPRAARVMLPHRQGQQKPSSFRPLQEATQNEGGAVFLKAV
jgi:hypothetical protein